MNRRRRESSRRKDVAGVTTVTDARMMDAVVWPLSHHAPNCMNSPFGRPFIVRGRPSVGISRSSRAVLRTAPDATICDTPRVPESSSKTDCVACRASTRDNGYGIPIAPELTALTPFGSRVIAPKEDARLGTGAHVSERCGRTWRFYYVTPVGLSLLRTSRQCYLRLWHGLKALLDGACPDRKIAIAGAAEIAPPSSVRPGQTSRSFKQTDHSLGSWLL